MPRTVEAALAKVHVVNAVELQRWLLRMSMLLIEEEVQTC
jgi:hypothetical protein